MQNKHTLEAFYKGTSTKMEERLRKAYQTSTGVDSTPSGTATLSHGIVVDKVTNKFMATYKVGDGLGSISKIFESRQDAEFWFDSLESLMQKGRLKGNLAALRQAEATRKATAAAINKIMEENITLKSETREAYKRKAEEGKDLFNSFFKKSGDDASRSTKVAKVRFFKTSLDQLQDHTVNTEVTEVEGMISGSWHSTLGWRPTTCIVFGDEFKAEAFDEFKKTSGLQILGLISSGSTMEPAEPTRGKLVEVASHSECKTPLIVHFVKGKFKTSSAAFEFNPSTKNVEKVTLDFISRRLNGESVQVLGIRKVEQKAAMARSAATRLQTKIWQVFVFRNPVHFFL